jgi:uncharacterized membrane protein YdcZ (DUF606 family)
MAGYFGVSGWMGTFLQEIPTIAFIGFTMGGAFAGLLAFTQRSRRLQDLSLWRIALWGAIGGFLAVGAISVIFSYFPSLGIWSSLTGLSAIFAAGHVGLAKRSERRVIEGDAEETYLLEEA